MAGGKAALVIGVDGEDGLGAGLARRFAREGYRVFIAAHSIDKLAKVARNVSDAGDIVAVVSDAVVKSDVVSLFDFADQDELLDLIVFNARRMQSGETSRRSGARGGMSNACLGWFLVGEEAGRRFAPRRRGTAILTSAGSPTVGIAAAGAAEQRGLRSMVRSMANKLSPLGVHVAHVIIDDGIGDEECPANAPARLKVDAISDAHWTLHRQHSSAWTHELDLRSNPFTSVAFTV